MSAPNTELSYNANTYDGYIASPFTPVSVANGDTVQLSSQRTLNVLRTTSDGTIAGAVINMPANPVNGSCVQVMVSGAITTVTGTMATATVPAISTLAAGTLTHFYYNSTTGMWFAGK